MRCAISGVAIKQSQLLLTCLPKSAGTASSMKPIWEAIAGSFKKMAEAGKGVLFVVAGDLEWFSSDFGWPTAMSNNPCPYCLCDNYFEEEKSVRPFTDFRKDATWKSTLRSVSAPPPASHPLFGVPGSSFWSMKLDLLHLVDLGVASHIHGNLLATIVKSLPMGKKRALVEVNKMVAMRYEELETPAGERIPRLNVSDIFGDEFPCLKHVKGRRVRKFATVATLLAGTLATNTKGKHMEALCKAMEEAYDLCDLKEYVWDKKVGQQFQEKTEAILGHYSWLAKNSMKSAECMWSLVQKHHLMAHYPAQCQYLAPRSCWAYGGESFMSLMVAVAGSSVKSTPAWMLPSKVLDKFEYAFHLMLEGIFNPDLEENEEV